MATSCRFRTAGAAATDGLPSYLALTQGAHAKPADHQKGIFFYGQFQEPGQSFSRIPAFIFHSNPYKRGAEITPWVDIIEPDEGYCLFHGDNRTPSRPPVSSRGNSRFVQCLELYADPALRKFAPPVVVFEQVEFDGVEGVSPLFGYGLPIRSALATHKASGQGYFTNLVVEVVLFKLDRRTTHFPGTGSTPVETERSMLKLRCAWHRAPGRSGCAEVISRSRAADGWWPVKRSSPNLNRPLLVPTSAEFFLKYCNTTDRRSTSLKGLLLSLRACPGATVHPGLGH